MKLELLYHLLGPIQFTECRKNYDLYANLNLKSRRATLHYRPFNKRLLYTNQEFRI